MSMFLQRTIANKVITIFDNNLMENLSLLNITIFSRYILHFTHGKHYRTQSG